MSFWKTGLALAGLAFAPLAIIAATHGSAAILGHDVQPNSEGARRDRVLINLTQAYVTRSAFVTPGMRGGKELAPVAFLNSELKRDGELWRVTKVDGLIAEMHEIS